MACVQKADSVQVRGKSGWRRFVIGRHPAWTFARVLLLILTSFFVFSFFLKPIKVTGNSMEPTYYDGQIGILGVLAYNWAQPKRGDVVGFRLENNQQIIVKRIVGLPGERIAFHSGVVFINGKSIEEPYLVSKSAWEWPEESLADNAYFVSGDNRMISQQFRVQRKKILGKIYNWRL